MAITRYTRRPFTPWGELDEFNDLMNRFFTRPTTEGRVTDWVPAVNVVEHADALELTAELPGMTAESVEIEFENDVLTIRGEKSEERTEGDDKRRYHVWERRSGSFQRSFTLPRAIDSAGITASFDNGVLTIRLPKAPEAQGRRIEITPALES